MAKLRPAVPNALQEGRADADGSSTRHSGFGPRIRPAQIIAARHNGALGGRPRNGETPAEARCRKLHVVESEVIPAPDGQNATVITYATHPEQQERFSGV